MTHGFVPARARAGKSARFALRLAVAGALLLGACSSSHKSNHHASNDDDDGAESDVQGAGQALTYYADAKPIIDQKCGLCHYDGGIGPIPFTTYDEVKPYVNLIKTDVENGIMPPWRATGDHDVFEGDRRLTDEQKETLLAWIDQGSTKGDRKQEPEPLEPEQRGLTRIDETLELSEAFTPDKDPDTYRCFVFEWPHDQRKFITGLSVEPGRPEMVHHAIVYLVAPNGADAVRQRDEAEPGPGYDCLTQLNLGAWLTSYEPGGYGQEFSGGIGMQIEPGSLVLLQIHYNTLNGKGEDRTHVDLTLEDEVERVGKTTLILNPLWAFPGFSTMLIPANNPDVVHRWAGVPTALQDGAQDIYAVDLHMHTLGRSGSIGIVRADGRSETLLDIPDWAFEWQETYRFKDPVRLSPGDQLFVECHFNNTDEKQLTVNGKRFTPRDVRWGENTTDEMCLGNVLTTPAL
jgi:Copper type II ascorbate-dependent monooxygenase, C-terminal domain